MLIAYLFQIMGFDLFNLVFISLIHTQQPQQFHLNKSISKQKVLISNSYICIYKTNVSTSWYYGYINNTCISSILINCRSLSFSEEWKSFQETLVVVGSESRKIVWNDSFPPIAGTCKITKTVINAAFAFQLY